MHVLSELRTPLFNNPDRQRALRALQMSRILRENNGTKAWQAVKSMIDKAIAEHTSSQRPQSQTPSAFGSPSMSVSTSVPGDTNSTRNVQVYPVMGEMPNYAIQAQQTPYTPHAMSMQPQQMQPQPEVLQPMQSMHEPIMPCWEDINLSNINNIVGDIQVAPGIVPDFDFVGILENPHCIPTNNFRASGVTLSITRMSRRPCPWRQAIFHHGPIKYNAAMNKPPHRTDPTMHVHCAHRNLIAMLSLDAALHR
jgi:hypothetical protein